MSTIAWTQLAPELSRLQSYYESVRGEVASSSLAAEAYSGINSQLGVISRDMFRMRERGDLGFAVVKGVPGAAETWILKANYIGAALQAILVQLDEGNLWKRAWSEISLQSAKDIQAGAVAVVAAAPTVFGGLVLVLVLLIALKVVR